MILKAFSFRASNRITADLAVLKLCTRVSLWKDLSLFFSTLFPIDSLMPAMYTKIQEKLDVTVLTWPGTDLP
jgi:hypothetical protein